MKKLLAVTLFFCSVGASAAQSEKATFALGCFWAAQTEFSELRGVSNVVAGYSGGKVENPIYEAVGEGTTGHAEAVDMDFDPRQISYKDLVTVFFTIHDPTTLNRQGNDVGPQYRSVLFYRNDEQRKVAEEVRQTFVSKYKSKIVTEIIPFQKFWPAEKYHQFYFAAHPKEPYCKWVVAGEVQKFRSEFPHLLKKSTPSK